ncbi:hypothetical protein K1719_015854 [Acacia pycnantha]|nr:hypothetical protein K1719_015854 [Acacia pycnantha]
MASNDSPYHGLLQLSNKTPFLGLKLYFVIGIFLLIVLEFLLMIFLYFRRSRISTKRKLRVKHSSGTIPLVSKDIVEVKSLDLEQNYELAKIKIGDEDSKKEKVEVEVERRGRKTSDESDVSGGSRSDVSVDARNIGWGRWYSLRELEDVTRGSAEESVIGEGGYGIVYKSS